jgi:hypothetical protein
MEGAWIDGAALTLRGTELAFCSIEAAGTGTIHSTITDNIVRVGLNYQFH